MVENSTLIKEILSTIINISGRKTTQSHAIYLVESTLNDLKKQYSFLENIDVKDTTYIEDAEPITIMAKEMNTIKSKDLGPAVRDIISKFNTSLGEQAGHFFIKEVSHKLNDEAVSALKNMGIDFDIMHLEQQITKMEKNLFK